MWVGSTSRHKHNNNDVRRSNKERNEFSGQHLNYRPSSSPSRTSAFSTYRSHNVSPRYGSAEGSQMSQQSIDSENRVDSYAKNWNTAASASSFGHSSPPISSAHENTNADNYQRSWNPINQSASPSIGTPLQFYDKAIIDVHCNASPPRSLSAWSDREHRQLESGPGIEIQPTTHWQSHNDPQRYQNWSADAGDDLAAVSDDRFGSWPNSNRSIYYSDIPLHEVSLLSYLVSPREII